MGLLALEFSWVDRRFSERNRIAIESGYERIDLHILVTNIFAGFFSFAHSFLPPYSPTPFEITATDFPTEK